MYQIFARHDTKNEAERYENKRIFIGFELHKDDLWSSLCNNDAGLRILMTSRLWQQ
jgi:hypothetical protein